MSWDLLYFLFSIQLCANRCTSSFSSTYTLHSSEKHIWPRLTRRFHQPCPQRAEFSRYTKKENVGGEEMKHCHHSSSSSSSTESKCVHVQQFHFPNNPPQCPPPLIIFLSLSYSPCPSSSRLLLSRSPSSRLQLPYSSWPTQHGLSYLCLALPLNAFTVFLSSLHPTIPR